MPLRMGIDPCPMLKICSWAVVEERLVLVAVLVKGWLPLVSRRWLSYDRLVCAAP